MVEGQKRMELECIIPTHSELKHHASDKVEDIIKSEVWVFLTMMNLSSW